VAAAIARTGSKEGILASSIQSTTIQPALGLVPVSLVSDLGTPMQLYLVHQ
jgi:hypothetical protein